MSGGRGDLGMEVQTKHPFMRMQRENATATGLVKLQNSHSNRSCDGNHVVVIVIVIVIVIVVVVVVVVVDKC